ncbi:MAG: hypothetical protein ABF370_14390 [Verrucomicrobiales bacterium]|jgi:hypothetical protein|nr:hypothetical protein [Verrucomicrobiaceae bacterium]
MKKTTLLAGASALAATLGFSYGQAFTTPVGYHTETAAGGGAFTVIGVNLVDAPLVSSALTGVAGATLTDANAPDFTTILAEGSDYSIEFANGQHSRITGNTANTVTTATELALDADPANNSYIIRKVRTLADYFGADNSAGFLSGSATEADNIWIPDGEGFKKAYYAEGLPAFLGITDGWRLVSTANEDQAGFGIDFTKGLIVERRGAEALDLTFTGHVKLTPTDVTADAGFTYLSRVYPTGSTLGNSGIAETALRGSATDATNIWMPDGAGFKKGYFAEGLPAFLGITDGWRLVSTANEDQTDFPLTSGIIVQRNQDQFDITLTPPAFYADL